MIYTVCIGHTSQMRNWSSERQGKTKKKANNQDHTRSRSIPV